MNKSNSPFRSASIRLLLGGIVLLGASCRAVGPNYSKPAIPSPPAWSSEMAGGLQPSPANDESLAQWWKTLNDPLLNSLIDRAVRGNLDLRRAATVVREARARRAIADTDRFPTVTTSGLSAFNRVSNRMGTAAEVGIFAAGFDAGWEMDVFGRVRRSIESADASLQASDEFLRDVLVSLVAEVAINYVEVREYQTQLTIAENNLRIQEESLRVARERFNAGLVSRLDVDQAQYAVSGTLARIPSLQIRLEQARNRLAVLLGSNPGEVGQELKQAGKIPVGPPEIAVGVPADTVRRRPDIRRAERILAARTAGVGVATAARYPGFYLPGSIGYEAITQGNPLALGNLIGSMAGSALFTVFDRGRIRQQIEVQNALQEQALVDYESSVLFAMEEVENALVAYADEQVRRKALLEGEEAAARAVEVVRQNYVAGLVDFLPVLESQRALLSFQEQVAQSDAAITSELIRLYKALGGGWTPLAPLPAGQTPRLQNQTGSNQ